MKFNKILIVHSNRKTKSHEEVLIKIKDILKKYNKQFTIITFDQIDEKYFKNIDLAVAVGGDGTFIKTSHFVRNIPILGINSDSQLSEGALTNLNENEIEKFEKIMCGEYKIVQKHRVRVLRNNKLIKELALNEVYVGTDKQFNTSRYVIKFKGKEEEHRSSGALIVTGLGSNAWYKSAGGKPFKHEEKKLKVLIREPMNARLFQPKLLNIEINEDEKILFESKRQEGGIVAIDCHKTYPFNMGDIVEIRFSHQPVNIVEKIK